ncbi:M23 family metallopeptidase [Leifsonia sp. McL0607]|uniref:M23 family metallopeptidase n=1 Tax=Leifsonia sp. McL0607 TaxID=3415672 RepID=UPI003CF18873
MKALVGTLGGVLALILGIAFSVVVGSSTAQAGCGGGVGTVNVQAIPSDAVIDGYVSEQLVNAAHIMNAAAALDLDVRAQQLGVMTAMGESGLRALSYGDNAINPDGSVADSIGLFQQQSTWGSTTDRMDPEISAALFFKRLSGVAGWQQMEPTLAAHAVQINEDPNYYAKFWPAAVSVTNELAQTYVSTGARACTAGTAAYPLNAPYMMTDGFGPRSAPTEGASSWHPAVDLVGKCGEPIYAILPGRVVVSDRLTLSIESPDGFTVSYLHSHLADRLVNIGDQVTRGQQISAVGNEAPSTGCHLDLRINVSGNKNPQVAQLATFPDAPGWVDPEAFMSLFGLELCPTDWCTRSY